MHPQRSIWLHPARPRSRGADGPVSPDQREPLNNPVRYSPGSNGVHRLALVTALATFPLLFVGGLVTSKGAGLAVPDWPTSFGHNMFLFPWSKMVGDIFYEHSHRLLASGVGLLTVVLVVMIWLVEERRWVRWLGAMALALVIVQGVIGGLRVLLIEEVLAVVHACLAQAFFALTVSLALFTSREWREKNQPIYGPDASSIRRLCLLTFCMIYVQGAFGAILRYTGTRLDAHVVFAGLVTVHAILLAARIHRHYSSEPMFSRPATVLLGLLVLQLALGLASYLAKFTSLGMIFGGSLQVLLPTTHLVVGALMLVTSLVLTLRSYRLLESPEFLVREGLASERFPA